MNLEFFLPAIPLLHPKPLEYSAAGKERNFVLLIFSWNFQRKVVKQILLLRRLSLPFFCLKYVCHINILSASLWFLSRLLDLCIFFLLLEFQICYLWNVSFFKKKQYKVFVGRVREAIHFLNLKKETYLHDILRVLLRVASGPGKVMEFCATWKKSGNFMKFWKVREF